MIPKYYCANAEYPAEATTVCCQSGCTASPFMCGNRRCPCNIPHTPKAHYMQPLDVITEEFKKHFTFSTVPAEVGSVSKMLDAFISEFSALKEKHDKYFTKHHRTNHYFFQLSRKVLERQRLEPAQATGDVFSKLLGGVNSQQPVPSPYRIKGEQFDEELLRIKDIAHTLSTRVKRLWKNSGHFEEIKKMNFRFSKDYRNKDIKIKEERTVACTSGTYDQGAALLEPCLPMNITSSITFQIGKVYESMALGVCFKDAVVSHKYLLSGQHHGMYLLYHNGSVIEGGTLQTQPVGFPFKVGDNVTLSVDPLHFRVTYSLEGSQSRGFIQNIQKEHFEHGQLYFVAYLRSQFMNGSEVKVISQ